MCPLFRKRSPPTLGVLCRLPRTGSAHDAHKLSPFNVKIYAFEHVQRLCAPIGFVDVFEVYHKIMSERWLLLSCRRRPCISAAGHERKRGLIVVPRCARFRWWCRRRPRAWLRCTSLLRPMRLRLPRVAPRVAQLSPWRRCWLRISPVVCARSA